MKRNGRENWRQKKPNPKQAFFSLISFHTGDTKSWEVRNFSCQSDREQATFNVEIEGILTEVVEVEVRERGPGSVAEFNQDNRSIERLSVYSLCRLNDQKRHCIS